MKKIFKYLLMLTIVFILPMFVLADETTNTFDHIDINPEVSLKYTVLGEVKPYSTQLDPSLSGLKIYELKEDGITKVEPAIDISSAEYIEDSSVYRVNGEFNKYYDGSDKEVKYLIEYTFHDYNINKDITYTQEYSFKSTDNGILIKLQDDNSIKTFAPSIVINKSLEKGTPKGIFKFEIKKLDGTPFKTVEVETSEGSSNVGGTGSVTVEGLEPDTIYIIQEIDIPNTYELDSISSDRDTDSEKNTITVKTTNSIDDVIEITAVNKSKVDHSKNRNDNGDGTYQLSLDVTGENEKGAVNKANVVVVLDVSGSMNSETGKTIKETYSAVAPGGNNLYGIVNGNYTSLSRNTDYSGNVYYTYRTYWGNETYNGILYERTTKETRMIAARDAVNSLANSLLGNNTAENPDIVKMALVTFSTKATTAVNPTFTYSDIETAVNKAYAQGGTNWEDALSTARGINFGNDRNDATTYVIFISDGNPTYRNNTNDNYDEFPLTENSGWYTTEHGRIEKKLWYTENYGYYQINHYYYDEFKNDDYYLNSDGVYGLGSDDPAAVNYSSTSMQRCYDHAKDDARLIVNTDKSILYSIGAYGNVNRMQSLTNYAYTGSDTTAPQGNYYYDASNTDALNQALKDILDAIERSGIGAVTIDDGTTNKITVETATGTEDIKLLTVDTTSYKYWLKFPVTVKNGKKYIYVNDTEVEVNDSATTLTWQGHDPLTITDSKFSDDNKYFIYSWKGENDFYNVAPPTAELVNGSVKWVLSKDNVGLLLDGVTYSVTFNVWPSQYTYDLIANLNNGIVKYDELPREIQTYLIEENGRYILCTNTVAKLTYDDSRDEVGSRTTNYVNPNPVDTNVSEISIEKEWYNGLDSRKASSIDIYLTKDTDIYKKYTLTSSNDWKAQVFISTGLISFDETTKTAIIREVGHDYSFKEGDDDAYNWDLVVDVVRPMIVNDKVKMLIKVNDSSISFNGNYYYDETTKKEYFKIDGNIYVVSDNNNSIIAKNYRRSNLNITKKVEGDYDPDTLFEFSLVVNDPKHNDVWFSILNGTDYVLNTNDTTYVSGAIPEIIKVSEHIAGIVNNGDGTISYYEDGKLKTVKFCKEIDGSYYTGFYYTPSGSIITARMKAGWNLRFTNLPNGSTYTFNEILSAVLGNNIKISDAFDFEKVELNVIQKDNDSNIKSNTTPYTSTTNTTVNNFKIEQYNTQYTVIYTNKSKTIPIEVVKNWEDNNNSNNTRPNSITVHLYADGNLKDTQIINSADNNWKYTWTNKAEYNAQGKKIVYTVTEEEVTNYITEINGLNITNYYNLRNITVTKKWSEGAKKASVVVRLTSKKGDSIDKTYDITLRDGNWEHTWTVTKYYLDENGKPKVFTYSVSEVSINGVELDDNNIVYDYNKYIHSTIGKWILNSITSDNDQSKFTIANDYKKYDKTLSFKKMSFKDYYNNPTNGLNGAVFRLYKYVGNGVSSNDPITNLDNPGDDWIIVDTVTSKNVNGVDGMMIFNRIFDGSEYLDGLYEGEYRLVEIQAPAGYVSVSGQWRLFIDLENDTVSVRKFNEYDTNHPVSIGKTTAPTTDGNGNIIILNEEVPDIPSTGGIGIPHYNNFGLLLMLFGISIYIINHLKQTKKIENNLI